MSARKQIGRFRIDEVLGYGGMGVVYRAHDLKLDRAVAIKVLPNISIDEGNPRPRLEQEARTLARFNHPNIASIYGLGETDDGSTYLVLELAEGQTLDERLRDSLPSVEQALQICRQVAAALLAAHERGVIHRDLKPQNVSIVREGMVKVLDFGLAKRVDAPSSPPAASTKAAGETVELSAPATEAGVIQGTPGYMSPEQIRGRNVDLRTDIFAFGCLLFECLTGTRAFPGDSLRTIFAATLSADPDWSLLPGEAPRGIRDLLRRCLEKDPERRLLDISEALSVLEEELGATASPSAEASAEVTFSHNLPTCLSSFVGRVRELNDVMELLKRSRLVTLTGSGGCGKTRLALRLAEELLPAYQDGVWLVELAAVSNQSQAPGALLNALKLREQPREPVLRTILESLEKQQALLIFDNCEHLLGACARIAEAVLQGCPQVKVIATSREGLGIPGETIYLVPSLSTAENIASPSARELEPYESVQLFLERAAAARPGFSLVDENAPHIARICHRLNGIPLAIELAATRLRAMALEQIAGRLEDNFRLLMSGSPTALPRHQTMRAAFDWSYNLLSAEEQLLLRRLSLFAGGWTLEAAESVCSDGSLEEGGELAAEGFPERIPDLLTSLVEKSLVIYADTPDGGGRYHLLQTGRQYAREELERSDGCDTARDRHISFFLALAEEAEPELRGPRQKAWLDRLEIEHENIKAALEWSRSAKDGDRKRLRLIGAIWRFWLIHGHFEYGSALLEEILREYEPAHRSRLWAGVHHGAGALSSIQGDHAAARARFQESLAIHRKLGDKRGIANMLGNLGLLASEHADYASASALYEESLGIFRELG
ncbi:MAG: protein kinase, partial [Planctomycetota bacterium]